MKKRKRIRVIVILVLIGLAVYFWTRPARSGAPDQKLAGHFTAMCSIAGDHVDTPKQGVDGLFAYVGKHSPDMLRELGQLMVLIERIDNDAAHDRRALEAHDRLAAPFKKCERTWMEFLEAVESDPAAARKLDHGINRLARALDLVFGGRKGGALPFGLPSAEQLLRGELR